MRLTHALPLPWPAVREAELPNWGLSLPTDAVVGVAKRVAIAVAALLLAPLVLVLGVIFVASTLPAWILTMPALASALIAEQTRPGACASIRHRTRRKANHVVSIPVHP